MDRVKCKPWGLFGGLSGFGNGVALHRFGKTDETHFPNGKALNQTLQAGDAYILRSGGGGGYGSPLERDLDALERDVRCGYVTQTVGGGELRRGVQGRHAGDRRRGHQGEARARCAPRACPTTTRSPRR